MAWPGAGWRLPSRLLQSAPMCWARRCYTKCPSSRSAWLCCCTSAAAAQVPMWTGPAAAGFGLGDLPCASELPSCTAGNCRACCDAPGLSYLVYLLPSAAVANSKGSQWSLASTCLRCAVLPTPAVAALPQATSGRTRARAAALVKVGHGWWHIVQQLACLACRVLLGCGYHPPL